MSLIFNVSSSYSTRVTTNTLSGSILAGSGNIQGLGTTDNVLFAGIITTGNVSGSVTSTGSFGRLEATIGPFFELDGDGDIMPL